MTTIEPTTIASRVPQTERPETSTVMRRYLIVTAVATPANLVIYLSLLLVADLAALVANIAAATAVTVPTYYANRAWVWRLGPDDARTAEGGQYWVSTMCSLALSSVTLWVLARSGAAPAVLAGAPLAVYTLLWVARFAFLDKYLFRRDAT